MPNVRFTMLDPGPGIKEQTGHSEVLIVGGGPVGMLLALFLDRYGVKSVVFNTEEGVPTHPRGSTHNSRTMEHFRRPHPQARLAARSSQGRGLFHAALWLGNRPLSHAFANRVGASDRRVAGNRSNPRADAPRGPDTCCGFSAQARTQAFQHRTALRMASRSV